MVRIAFDKEEVLAHHFLLRHLAPEDLKRLAALTTLANYPAGATIFQKGDPGASMMAVIRGRVKMAVHSPEGKELVLNIMGRGGLFGEVALIDGEPRSADAVTLEETDLLVLERARFRPFLAANPAVAERLLEALCKRLRRTSEHLEDVLFLEAPSRLARWLLRLRDEFGKPAPHGTRLDIKLSQGQIGSLVGISRESVNKTLGDWQKAQLIAIEHGTITLLDADGLTALGEGEG